MIVTAIVLVGAGLVVDGRGIGDAPAALSQATAVYAVGSPDVLPYATSEEARANAVNVLEVALDHVGLPRGLTGGDCHVTGDVVRVVRGAGLTPRGRIALSVPCAARPRPGEARRIPEGVLVRGGSSLFYFSASQELVDVGPVPHATAPDGRAGGDGPLR